MDEKKTGTTTVGLICKDCVVLAADKRATAGHFIADKETQKVFTITDKLAVTIAGSVSSIQMILKYFKSELKLRELRTGRETTVKEAANLLAGWVYSTIRAPSMIPGVMQFILAGTDKEGIHLYDIYPDGTITEIKDYYSSGSGSVFVFGVLEDSYKANLSEQEGVELALRAVGAALKRDSASGNGCDVLVINKDGIREVARKKIDQELK